MINLENILLITGISNFISIAATQILYGLLIIFLFKKIFKENIKLQEIPFWKYFLTYFILVEISIILNYPEVKHFHKKLFSWWLYFPFFISYFLIDSERLANKVIKFSLIGASFSSMYGLYQFLFLHERAKGFYSHALTSANNWALALLLSYFFLLKSKFKDKFFIFTTIFTSIGLLVSESKGPILYFFIIFSIINIIFFKKKGILLNGMIFLIIMLSIIFVKPINKRFTDIYKGINNPYTSTGNRVVLWKNTIKIIKEHPLFGIGGGFKKEIVKKAKINLKWKSHPHNAFLTVAVLHGVLALIALLIIFFQIYKKLFLYKDNFYSIIGIFFITLYLMEGLTENNFGDSEVKMFFWFIMGIIISQISMVERLKNFKY